VQPIRESSPQILDKAEKDIQRIVWFLQSMGEKKKKVVLTFPLFILSPLNQILRVVYT